MFTHCPSDTGSSFRPRRRRRGPAAGPGEGRAGAGSKAARRGRAGPARVGTARAAGSGGRVVVVGGGGSPAGGVRRVRGGCEARPGGRSIPRVSRTRCFRSLGPENLPLGGEGLLRAPLESSAALPPVPLIYYPVPAIVGGAICGLEEGRGRRPRVSLRALAQGFGGLGPSAAGSPRPPPRGWERAGARAAGRRRGSSQRHRLCKQLRAALPARAQSLTQTPCRRLSAPGRGWGVGGGARLL